MSPRKVNDDDAAMEKASDDEPTPPPILVHVGFTMGQAQENFNAIMTEEHPVSALRHAQEE